MDTKEILRRYRERHREELNRKAKEYYQKNKERLNNDPKRLERIAKWQKEHPERTKATTKRYHESHKEQITKYRKRYRNENKEKILEHDRQWRIDNPEKYEAIKKRNVERLRASGFITNRILFKAKRILLEKNPRLGICNMCGQKGRTEIHHIKYHIKDPLRDTIEVCARCHRKREQEYGEWRTKK